MQRSLNALIIDWDILKIQHIGKHWWSEWQSIMTQMKLVRPGLMGCDWELRKYLSNCRTNVKHFLYNQCYFVVTSHVTDVRYFVVCLDLCYWQCQTVFPTKSSLGSSSCFSKYYILYYICRVRSISIGTGAKNLNLLQVSLQLLNTSSGYFPHLLTLPQYNEIND